MHHIAVLAALQNFSVRLKADTAVLVRGFIPHCIHIAKTSDRSVDVYITMLDNS